MQDLLDLVQRFAAAVLVLSVSPRLLHKLADVDVPFFSIYSDTDSRLLDALSRFSLAIGLLRRRVSDALRLLSRLMKIFLIAPTSPTARSHRAA